MALIGNLFHWRKLIQGRILFHGIKVTKPQVSVTILAYPLVYQPLST
jgi:hypothetical protein